MIEAFPNAAAFCKHWSARINDPGEIHRMARENFDNVPSLVTVKSMIFDAINAERKAEKFHALRPALEHTDAREELTAISGDPLLTALWREHPRILAYLGAKPMTGMVRR